MSDRLIKESDVLKAIDKRIKELSKHPEFVRKNGHIDVIGVKKYILAIPSADRPQGKWIYCEEDDSHLPEDGRYGIFKCSNCGSKQSFPISEGSGRVYGDNYCPSCGARMKGADDD